MGTQIIANASMFLFKTFSETSKTKDRLDSGMSFKDVFKKTTADAGDVDNKGGVLPKKVLAWGCRSAALSSQGQVQKDTLNVQKDNHFTQELPDGTNSDLENQVQSQVLQAQVIEFLQLIISLLQRSRNLDKSNLEKLFQNSSIQVTDFLNLQLRPEQMDINLVQNLNDNLNNKIVISEFLQNIVQEIEQKTQNQQVLSYSFVQGNGNSAENIYKLLEELLFGKESQKLFFEVKSHNSSLLKSLRNLFSQEGQSLEVLLEANEGAKILERVLKELENVFKKSNGLKIVNNFYLENSRKAEIGEKATSNFNGIGSNDNNFYKIFSTLLSKGNNPNVNDEEGEAKTEILDLRQHTFALQNKIEDIENTVLFQDDKRIKELRMFIISQLAEKISTIHKQNITTLQVSIKPEWLGSVVIELSKDSSGKIFGNLIVTSPQVKEIIEGSLSSLLTILKDQGINISQLNVSLGGSNTGQQYQEQQRFSQRRNLFLQSNDDSSRNIESLIYEMSESILNLRA
ncbi:flagellar hook-length control protein FliK [Anaerocellum danielii]|uniref:Flagellar hook-length control protein FliK n=1 Tax=Anaerocellum danielii TaxID=1387557 RepID=A0ABZ0TZX3_9FIRM|nr:flagellar hook-length control protein FliK [Caldicellulosiruptor danielii]WPX08402.1 flagellar hook-length control protein FliK [Caldicellulosiruptor danielii]